MTLSVDRSTVRTTGRRARRAVQGDTRVRAEAMLVGHLRSLHSVGAASVGVFFANDGEPDLLPLVEHLWDLGQIVALPLVTEEGGDDSMQFVRWCRGDALVPGRFDIPVPPNGQQLNPETLLVSFTGFDRQGNRMGRGAGFFDRYLTTTKAQVVGVGFEAQRFDAIPIEPHDVPVPVVVTELGVRFTT